MMGLLPLPMLLLDERASFAVDTDDDDVSHFDWEVVEGTASPPPAALGSVTLLGVLPYTKPMDNKSSSKLSTY